MKPHFRLHVVEHAAWGIAWYVKIGSASTFLFSEPQWAMRAAFHQHFRRRWGSR